MSLCKAGQKLRSAPPLQRLVSVSALVEDFLPFSPSLIDSVDSLSIVSLDFQHQNQSSMSNGVNNLESSFSQY